MSRLRGLAVERAGGPRMERRPRRAGSDVLVPVVTRVASAVRAGAAPTAAWADLGVRCVVGVPVERDLLALGGTPSTAVAVGAAATVTARSGAPPAAVLESLAAALEREAELDARRRAELAGPLASARLLAWLPVLGLLLGAAVGADPFSVLLDGGAGTALLAAGAGAAWLGRAWTSHLVRVASAAGRDDAGPDLGARVPGVGRRLAALRGAGQRAVEVPVAAVLELVAAACAAGATVPGALEVVGGAAGGRRGAALAEAAAMLRLGAGWAEAWAGGEPGLRPLADALGPAWRAGAGPVGLLHAAARERRREQTAAAAEAAGRLGVRLLLPLALCHLPAFVMVGLVPVLVSLARGALSGSA